jgi:hypothetical protein
MEPEWMFVAGRSFLAAVPADAPVDLAQALISRIAEPLVSAESLVGLLPLGGEEALGSFALVILDAGAPGAAAGEPAVTVVVRGPIAVDVYSIGGSRRFTDQGIRPWHLADFPGVIGVVIGSPDEAVLTTVPEGRLGGSEPGWVVAGTAHWRLVETSVAEDTIIRPREDSVIRPPGDTVIRARDDTVIRRGDDTVLTAGRGPGARVSVGDRDNEPGIETQNVTEASGVTEAPAALRPAPARFRLADGREFALDRPHRLGRRPALPRIPADQLITLIAVASPGSLVSATHVDLRQVGGVIVVTDTGSRNGTVVVSADGRRERLRPGDSRTVLPGTRIDLGDDNIIEILPASGTESAPYFPAQRGRHHP